MAEGGTFDGLKPPKKVTDPNSTAAGQFPRHVHKFAGLNEDGSPKLNTYKLIHTADEFAAALKDGWSEQPVMKAPKAGKSDA